MHRRLWATALAALAVPLAVVMPLAIPAVAQASVGVGIQAGPVRLTGAAHPGGSYALPPVYVENTGTQPESVYVRIERLSSGSGRPVPPAWVHAASQGIHLGHGQSVRIPLELVLPAAVKPGQYLSDVVVRGSAALSDGHANFGVAAATKLEFRVVPGAVAAPWFSMPGWVLLGVLAVVLIAAAAIVARRSGLRIRIDRQPFAAGSLPGRGDDHVS